MPETQEKPRVDLRQVITSPQFLSGIDALIKQAEGTGYEPLFVVKADNSGKILYEPQMIIGDPQNVSEKVKQDRDISAYVHSLGAGTESFEEFRRKRPIPLEIPYPLQEGISFVPEGIKPREWDYLTHAHAHPNRESQPGLSDLRKLNLMKKRNMFVHSMGLNPFLTIVGIPQGQETGEYDVLFVQEDQVRSPTEQVIETIPKRENWVLSRSGNPFYEQAQAKYKRADRKLELITQPFTLSA